MLDQIVDEIDLEPAYDNQDPLPVMFCGLCKHFDERRNCCLIKREWDWLEGSHQVLAYRTAEHPACEELVVEFEHF